MRTLAKACALVLVFLPVIGTAQHVKFLSYLDVNGEQVPILRVTNEEIKSLAKKNIISIQKDLDKCMEYCTSVTETPYHLFNQISTMLMVIDAKDSDWPRHFYNKELTFYKKQDRKLKTEKREEKRAIEMAEIKKRKENLRADSIVSARMKDPRVVDSLNRAWEKSEQQRLLAEKIRRYEERMKLFDFVNVESLNLREKPSKDSKKIATVGACSHVSVMSEKPLNGYVEVFAGDYHGYVYAKYLVGRVEELTIESNSKETALQMYFVHVESKNNTGITDECYYNGQRLFKGPEGGCFYYTHSGKKRYVKRYKCAGCK